jgi:hypothetical protein
MSDGGAIFIVQGDGLVELAEEDYFREEELQEFLATYPKLLAGEQIAPDAPRRWLLVRREMDVPDDEGAGGRWSVDHLFVDQDGVPTLVEVKRSSDSRIRREVVGQMLDYAANAVAYWPIEKLVAAFERTCTDDGVDPTDRLAQFLGDEYEPNAFWDLVNTNLLAGRVRMLFVADEIPPELRQIVRFLQSQMSPAEVYAIELPRYRGEGIAALVPRLVTQSAAESTKASKGSKPPRVRREDFLAALAVDERRLAERLLSWAAERRLNIRWGRGKSPSFGPKFDHQGVQHHTFNLYQDGRLEVPFGAMKAPYDDEERRTGLLASLNEAGLGYPGEAVDKYPQGRIEPLLEEENLARFLEVWDSYLDDCRKG